MTLELGSIVAVVIDRDGNIEKIILRCMIGAFSNQDQVCNSLQLVYVQSYTHIGEESRIVKEQMKLVKKRMGLRQGGAIN